MASKKLKTSAFTLVEIMIVILIIGVLLAVAIPSFLQARETSRAKSCIANLRQIDNAKQQWAMDTKAALTASPVITDLSPTYIVTYPTCPAGGTFTIGIVSTNPICSIGVNATNTNWSHVLP